MDGLMAAFVAALLLQVGDRPMRLAGALGCAGRPGAVAAGAGAASVVASIVAALIGAVMAPLLPTRAAGLLLALALLSAGISGFLPLKAAPAKPSRLGAFAAALFGCLALALGDRAQFVTTALAARGPGALTPVLAGVGGALGSLAAIVPASLAADHLRTLPLAAFRGVTGGLFVLVGAWVALDALGLI